MADWSLSVPADDATVASIPGHMRDTRDTLEVVIEREHADVSESSGTVSGGEHLNGSAVCYEGTSTPTNRPDAATALANNAIDRGRLWLDDNFDPPVLKRWDGSAFETLGSYITDAASVTLILHNMVEEDGDGGRESRIIAYGEQSGGERSTLGWLEFSHDGASDDQKGKCRLLLNDGDDDDAPSKIAIELHADGTIEAYVDATNGSVCVLDEDSMASDSAVKLCTQQSIKAYIDADHPAYSGGESHVDGSGLIVKMGEVTVAANSTTGVTFEAAFPTAAISVVMTLKQGTLATVAGVHGVHTVSATGFTAENGMDAEYDFYWIAIGH